MVSEHPASLVPHGRGEGTRGGLRPPHGGGGGDCGWPFVSGRSAMS